MRCMQEHGKPDSVIYPTELRDDGCYTLTCRFGHEFTTVLQEQRFELLFDLGVNAILDGYYREAVSSFTASLERFFEFYLRVTAAKNKVEEDAFALAWKLVRKQSERQLGAYVMVYAMQNGKPPPMLSESQMSFRNDVTHKGKIPTRDEAIEHGEAVRNIISPVLKDLKTSSADAVQQVIQQHIRDLHSGIPAVKIRATMAYPTIISITRAFSEPEPSILDWVEQLRRRRASSGW